MDMIKPKVDTHGAKGDFNFDKWKADKIKAGQWVGGDEPNPKLAKPKAPYAGSTTNYSPR